MKTRDENGHFLIGGYLLLALGLLTLALFAKGVGNLVEGVVAPRFGWTYEFKSIGDVLHVHDPKFKPLSWDHSVLFIAAAFGSGWLTGRVNAFLQWLERTPGERVKAREHREREREQIRAEIAKHYRHQKEQKAARKAARKPMSGWRRLWIVLSVVFGVFAAIIAWQPTRHDYVRVSNSITTNGEVWATPQMQDELSRCEASTANATYAFGDASTYTYVVDCEDKDPLTPSLLWALFPALFMAAVGLTVRWIYRGFRAPKALSLAPAGEKVN